MAVSWTKCLLTVFTIAEKVRPEGCDQRQALLMECVGLVAVRGTRMTWPAQRALFSVLHAMVSSSWLAADHVRALVQTVLGERGLLPQAFVQTTNRAVQSAAVNLVKELLQSKSVVILQDVYSLLCMRLEQATVSLTSSKPFLSSNIWAGV